MRILIVGSTHVAALEQTYHRYFREWGAESEIFDARQPVGWIHSLPKKGVNAIRRFLPSTGLGAVNTLLLEKVRQWKPEVVWVFKGMEVLPSTLNRLRGQVPLLASYNPDHPFQFTGPGSGNALMTRSLPLYHAHLTYQEAIADRLRAETGLPVACVPFGFDLDEPTWDAVAGLPEIVRVGFVGNADAERAAAIQTLLAAGLPVDVFGGGWSKYLSDFSGLRVFKPVFGKEFWEKMHVYRVQLNLLRPHNEGSHNMRSFDIPGAGGVQLAPDSREHRSFFADNQEIFLFSSPEEMLSKARILLSLSGEKAEQARQAARTRSLDAGYHYKDRAMEVLHFFQECIRKKNG